MLYGGLGDDDMTGGGGDDTYHVNSAGDQVHELADGGIDKIITSIDYSLDGSEVETLLAAADAPGLILTGNGLGNKITGGGGGDTLSGGGDNDKIGGGGGDDLIAGGTGADLLTGGGGGDVFIYESLGDSTVASAGRDQIVDFLTGSDQIDLHLIDAVTGGGDTAFNFVGAGAFQNAGDLRAFASGANTMVAGDVDGDHVADFQILLKGSLGLSDTDFIL
jgi:Ca2+-binding RTX toxin-like protein